MLSSVSAEVAEITADYETYDVTIVSGLTAVAELLVGQPVAESDAFRGASIQVLRAGMAPARCPYGKKPTTESAQMLTMLQEFLRPGITFAA